MKELRRKIILPVFRLSELASEDSPLAMKREIKQGKGHQAFTYYYRFVWDEQVGHGFNYNLFPIVLDQNGQPWYLGSLYILSLLEADTAPNMTSYQSKADDLGAYKEWLDTLDNPENLMFSFPKLKLRRPTYRYRGHLQQQIQAREIAPSTANRRMGTVVSFYSWMIDMHYFQPEYPPWEDKQFQLSFKTIEGRAILKKVTSTDISIRTPKSENPFAGTIQDGGKLRPLSGKEQGWILEASLEKGNTECYLIQLFMLATGARIQTAGTLRLRHFIESTPGYSKSLTGEGEVFRLRAGPGTGIDTKNDKNGVLHVPRSIYELFHTYAMSERAKIRRGRFLAKLGEHSDPYLFLTQQGNPYYRAKADTLRFNPGLDRRHEKKGQTVRQFLTDQVIPYVREHHDKQFHYQIHDLRASFGMNMTELLMGLVQSKTIPLSKARDIVRELLWHESLGTTDLYINYRSQMDVIFEAVNSYGQQLQEWIEHAMKSKKIIDE